MHTECMATKTISLSLDAYERLRAARQHPRESFSSVLRRARWDEEGTPVTGAEVLHYYRTRFQKHPERLLNQTELDALDDRVTRGRTTRSDSGWGVG